MIDKTESEIMSYQNLMVHMRCGHSSEAVLQVAKKISNYSPAAILGVMAEQQTQMIYGRGYATLDFFDREQAHLREIIAVEEITFNTAFKDNLKPIKWRSVVSMEPASDFIVSHARSVDLIITGIASSDFYEGPNTANAGAIVMQAGRPVLAVPLNNNEFNLDHILVGWKDTREARRAIVDALPLLKMAKQVTILEIAERDDEAIAVERLNEIIAWLGSHYVKAKPMVSIAIDADAIQFINITSQLKPNVVVIGAYGHSRFREWVLGGVTNELLQSAQFNLLLSH